MINNRQTGRRRGRGGQQQQRSQANPGRGQDNGNRIDNRARGNASQLLEKYKTLARDSQMQGDRVTTEYYLQFADHYFRVLSETRSRFEENRRQNGGAAFEEDDQDYDDDGESIVRADQRGVTGSQFAQDVFDEDRPRRDEDRPRRQVQANGNASNGNGQSDRYTRDDRTPDRANERAVGERGPDRNERQGQSADRGAGRDRGAGDRSAQRGERPASDRSGNDRSGNERSGNDRSGNERATSERTARPSFDGGEGQDGRQPRAAAPARTGEAESGERGVEEQGAAADAPRRRGRPRRDVPVEPEAAIEDRLPPSLTLSAVAGDEPSTDPDPVDKPRRRRRLSTETSPPAA